MKHVFLFMIICSTLFFLSCKQSGESSKTSASSLYNECACNDLTCWNNQSPDLHHFTCVLNTGLVTPGIGGMATTISSSLAKKIKSSCNFEITPHIVSLLQDTNCSVSEIKRLSDTYADVVKIKTTPNINDIKKNSLLPSYDCSGDSMCNLGTMHLYGQRKNDTYNRAAWITRSKQSDYCYDTCLSTSRQRYCSSTLSDYFGTSKPKCETACSETNCPQALTLCLEQCCGSENWTCVIDAIKKSTP